MLSRNKPQNTVTFNFQDLFNSGYRLITLLLIALSILVYGQVYSFELFWDDNGTVNGIGVGHLFNPFVQSPSWQSFIQLFTQPFFGMYIPISYLGWGILKSFAELLSLPVNSILHLSNVIVHIVNGLLLFTILKQFVANKWAVALGVGFFLLHPIQVEAVAWVSEFRGLLATLFVLLSLYHYLKQQTQLHPNKQTSNKQTHLSAKKQSKRTSQNQTITAYLPWIFFILAVLSKPSAVVLVPFVFLTNHFHFGLKIGKNIAKTLPYALIALMVVLIAHSVQSKFSADMSQYAIASWQRPFAWLDSIVFYLYKIIYPYHLSASYTLSPKFISSQWWFYPLVLLPIGLGYLLWLKRNSQPMIVFASTLFIAGFFTTSGLVSFVFQKYSLVADRYVYFAMIGVALFVTTVFNKTDKKVWQGLIISVSIVLVLLSTFRQIPIWQTAFKLWSHSINYEVTPQYAHQGLATVFHNKGAEAINNTKKYEQAVIYSNRAIKYYPKHRTFKISDVILNKGLAFLNLKRHQRALAMFNQALKNNIKNDGAHNMRIRVLTLLKQCQKAKIALKEAQQHEIKLPVQTLTNLKQQCPN